MKRVRAAKLLLLLIVVLSLLFSNVKVNADSITLISGDTIRGDVIEQTEINVLIDHNDLGVLNVPVNKIKTITIDNTENDTIGPDTQTKDKTIESKEIAKKTTRHDKDFPIINPVAMKLKKNGWSFSADLSMDSSTGNTDEQTLRAGLDAKRTLPERELTMDFSYYNKVSDGTTSDNKFSYGVLHDWLIPKSRWFFFVTARYDYDEFESWQQRVSAHAGPGYNLIKKDDFKLDLRAGAGTRKEFGSENNNFKSEGLGRLDVEWNINKKQSINMSASAFPVFSDFNDFRTRTTANWKYSFDDEMNLSFLVGILHEYQAVVDPDKDKNDFRLYTGIQFSF